MTPERVLAHEMDAQLLRASGWLQTVAMVQLDSSGRRLGPGGFLPKKKKKKEIELMAESDRAGDTDWEEFGESQRVFGVVHECQCRIQLSVE
jgi:hypothetical protein